MKKFIAMLCLSAALISCGGQSVDVKKEEINKSTEKYNIAVSLPNVTGKLDSDLQAKIDEINKNIKDKASEIEAKQESINVEMPYTLNSTYEVFDNKTLGVKSIVIDSSLFEGGAHPESARVAINIDTKNNTEYDLEDKLNDEQKQHILDMINNAIDTKQNFDGTPIDVFEEHIDDFAYIPFYFKDDKAIAYFNPATIGPYASGIIEFSFTADEIKSK